MRLATYELCACADPPFVPWATMAQRLTSAGLLPTGDVADDTPAMHPRRPLVVRVAWQGGESPLTAATSLYHNAMLADPNHNAMFADPNHNTELADPNPSPSPNGQGGEQVWALTLTVSPTLSLYPSLHPNPNPSPSPSPVPKPNP